MEFFNNNWVEIILAIITLLGTITALTETQADDNIVNILKRILQAVVFGKNRRRK